MKNTTAERLHESVKDMLPHIYTIQNDTQYENGYDEASHVQNKVEIIWMQSGSGFHEVNTCCNQLNNNRVYCVMPGQLHHLQIDHGSHGYVICFDRSFLDGHEDLSGIYNNRLFLMLSQLPGMLLEKSIAQDMHEIISKMIKEINCSLLLNTEMLRRYLEVFVLQIVRQFHIQHPDMLSLKRAGVFDKFINLLEKNFRTKKMVSDYARELFITPNYLNELIRKNSGYPARYHISRRVMQEAKRKALYSEKSMKEIAYELGFEDVAHFSKYFKNVSGKNFSDYRKQCFDNYL
jgi:AraC-like DNA-binding protein